MAFPDYAHDEILLEFVGQSSGPDDVGAYNFVSDWLPTGDVQSISVSILAPNQPAGAAIEEGMYRSTSTEPDTVGWLPLPDFADHVGPSGRHFRTSVGQADLTGRYFRLHVFGYESISSGFVTVRALRRGVR